VPASRNYADAWRDSWATLAQIPVAGLLASNEFCSRWVEVSSTYLSQVSTRLALARPAAAADATPDKSVMAGVLSEDLVEATQALVRDVVSLPGQTATFFNRRLEDMVGEVLARVQPDAKTDLRTYLVKELEKINRELSRLREVVGAETARGEIADPGKSPVEPASVRALKEVLDVMQATVTAALKKFPPNAPRNRSKEDEPSRAFDLAMRAVLAIRRAQDEVGGVQQEIREERERAARPRTRRQVRRTRR
jgi:hypothetical protein